MEYYVVIDLEMCRVPKNMRSEFHHIQETIQIGAALMNEEYEVVDTFSTFVKPKYGYLDGFIKHLTGITESDLTDAPDIRTAMELFLNWLPEDGNVTAISWSDSDKYQIIHEFTDKKIELDSQLSGMLDTWIDCQPEFSEKMKMHKNYSLQEALVATDIITNSRAHNGLDDAYNTALLYAKMKREDELVINPYYKMAHNDSATEPLSFGLGDIMAAAGF